LLKFYEVFFSPLQVQLYLFTATPMSCRGQGSLPYVTAALEGGYSSKDAALSGIHTNSTLVCRQVLLVRKAEREDRSYKGRTQESAIILYSFRALGMKQESANWNSHVLFLFPVPIRCPCASS